MYLEGVNGFTKTLAPRPANLATVPTQVLRQMQARANDRLLFGDFTGPLGSESRALLKAHLADLAQELEAR